MSTRIDEIGDGIYRISTFMPEVAPPAGFTFNQFLIDDEEPLLFHCGMRGIFPQVSEAVTKVLPVERLRWIGFGHIEADECGAMNAWLAKAPRAQLVHSEIGCAVSLNDLAERAPRALADGETIELGRKRVRYLYTPQVPHGWDAGLMFEETTGTLFCGDLLTHLGNTAPMTDGDILGPAIEAEDMFTASAITPGSSAMVRRLAVLAPRRLALMHGASYEGDCAGALLGLAADFDRRLQHAMAA